MIMPSITTAELEAYLDEALPAGQMASIEAALRDSPELLDQLSAINRRRDAGVHSLGEVWRRHRMSCPTREELGRYLMQAMDPEHADFIRFHVEVSGCRFCAANVEDLQRRMEETADAANTRQRRYFESSAGYLKRKKGG
jgi:hypothetical protein